VSQGGIVISYDVAVVGLGTMGSFACCELARRGLRVVGLDRFSPPHDRGSHSGGTRVFRIAYAEHPDYVPLARHAGMLWEQYATAEGVPLLHRCGLLSIGEPDSALLRGTRKSSEEHGLSTTAYTSQEIRKLFPAIHPSAEQIGIFEPEAGWIDVNAAIEVARRLSKLAGATLLDDSPALDIVNRTSHFEIVTPSQSITAERVAVTAGAWCGQLLSQLGLPLRVVRKVVLWVNPLEPEQFTPQRLPIFAFAERFFYGFPTVCGPDVKIAVHWEPGQTVADPTLPVEAPTMEEASPVLELAAKYLPALAGPLPSAFARVTQIKTCLYTMTPDEHFLIDRHPEWRNLVFAAGFSGHGFKFAPVVGEALADMITLGETSLPIGFLRIGGRFST
jgi:monomeric sarcosine oxidase